MTPNATKIDFEKAELNYKRVTIPKKVESGNKTIWKGSRWPMVKYRNDWYKILPLFLGTLPRKPSHRMHVKITSYRKRFLDYGNFVQGNKPILDYLKKANYIKDDSPHWINDTYIQVIDSDNERTEIIISKEPII